MDNSKSENIASDQNDPLANSKTLQSFNDNFTKLINICKAILAKDNEQEIDLGRRSNPIETAFKNYAYMYEKDVKDNDLDIHFDIVQNCYFNIANDISENDLLDDSWLRNSIIFDYGGKGKRKVKIMISSIYKKACQLKEQTHIKAQQRLVGVKKCEVDALMEELKDEFPELIYPDEFHLILTRLFHSVAISKDEKDSLSKRIRSLRVELGYDEKKNNMSGLFGMAKGMMERMGLNIPEDKLPDEEQVGQVMSGIFGNEKTQQALGDIFKDVQNCNNLGQVLNKLATKLGDRELTQAISETLQQNNLSSDDSSELPANSENIGQMAQKLIGGLATATNNVSSSMDASNTSESSDTVTSSTDETFNTESSNTVTSSTDETFNTEFSNGESIGITTPNTGISDTGTSNIIQPSVSSSRSSNTKSNKAPPPKILF